MDKFFKKLSKDYLIELLIDGEIDLINKRIKKGEEYTINEMIDFLNDVKYNLKVIKSRKGIGGRGKTQAQKYYYEAKSHYPNDMKFHQYEYYVRKKRLEEFPGESVSEADIYDADAFRQQKHRDKKSM